MGSQVDLHGLRLRIDGTPASLDRALAVLEHFGATPSPPDEPDLRIVFEIAGDLRRPKAPQTARHLDITIHRDEHGLHLCSPTTTTRIAGDLARIVAHDDQPVPLHVFTCVLFHLVRPHGLYGIHAATMSLDGRGCVIVGPSGSGKSTLTLALGRLGWARVSDDSILLRRAGTSLLALGLRRGLFLDPTTVPALPAGARWLPCPLVEAVKQELLLEEDPRAASTTPLLILLPEIVDADRTTFEPVDPIDACWALAVESRLGELDRTGAAAHLALLCDLAARTPALRARLGRDVLRAAPELGDTLASRLGRELPQLGAPIGHPPMSAHLTDLHRPIYAPLPPDRGVLLHPESLEFFALDRTGARIWELATHLPVPRVAETLAAELDVSNVDLHAEVQRFLDDLAGEGFVPRPPAPP